jgi:arginine exporter protein ArgO
MGNLLLILGVLLVSLVLFTQLTERFAKPMDPAKVAQISRWILPLVGVVIVLQAIRYFF